MRAQGKATTEPDKRPEIPDVNNSSSWLLEGGTSDNWSSNFEEYVSKVFSPAYNEFEKDDTVRRITNEAKLNLGPRAGTLDKNLRTKLGDSYSHFLLDDERYDVDMSKYADDYRGAPYDAFKVYEPKHYKPRFSTRTQKSFVTISALKNDPYGNSHDDYDCTKDLAARGQAFERSVLANPSYTSTTQMNDNPSYPSRNRSSGNHIMIDCSQIKHRKTDQSPTSYALERSNIRTEDSRIVGTDFIMLNLRPPDRWYDKVDKLLQEARHTNINY